MPEWHPLYILCWGIEMYGHDNIKRIKLQSHFSGSSKMKPANHSSLLLQIEYNSSS
ncbi:hypothetical protein M378DRAFT_168735, partial [Amanita muscaria Koide BX008]